MDWKALPEATLRKRVFDALGRNHSYAAGPVLGLPGSFLDREVFPPLPELARFPLLAAMIDNPNHIGCHTLGDSEPAFQGTQDLERDVVRICAEGLLHAPPATVDGYVASGGTESNIQALWAFRNKLRHEGVERGRIALLTSEDTHYSIAKAADLLDLPLWTVPVDPETRRMPPEAVRRCARDARDAGHTWVLVVLTMGTTMFGSVDAVDDVLPHLEAEGLQTLVHIDGAFGGFIYPLTGENALDFRDARIHSITLDAHKMLQAPYGTGIHLVRKGFIQHVLSDRARYVPGLDCTLSGSRSGANAVAVWMILHTYGKEGGRRFCEALVTRTRGLVDALRARGIRLFHQQGMNLVTLNAADVPRTVAERFQLVPDDHDAPKWWKIVVMDHVTDEQLDAFLAALDHAALHTT